MVRSQPTRGDTNHNTSQGPATGRFDGAQRCTAHPAIKLKMLDKPSEMTNARTFPGAFQCIAWAEVHSSNLRCEISRRYQIRKTASKVSQVWCGSSAASTIALSRSCVTFENEKPFSHPPAVAHVKGCTRGWKSSCMATTQVDIHPILEEISQETMSKPRLVGGTMLRRRLSKIFQRSNQESGFFPRRPVGWGARGKIHSAICQSPRIHRCCRPV